LVRQQRFCSGGSSGSGSGIATATTETTETLADAAGSGIAAAASETLADGLKAQDDVRPERARNTGLRMGADPSAASVIETMNVADSESYPRLQKPFIDRLWVVAKAGNGGNPAVNAVRSPGLKGPGYGGHGGAVFLKASRLIESFLDVPEKIK
ncbi:unnamed protein product, partial [Polarella glacialis]